MQFVALHEKQDFAPALIRNPSLNRKKSIKQADQYCVMYETKNSRGLLETRQQLLQQGKKVCTNNCFPMLSQTGYEKSRTSYSALLLTAFPCGKQ